MCYLKNRTVAMVFHLARNIENLLRISILLTNELKLHFSYPQLKYNIHLYLYRRHAQKKFQPL